MYTNKSKERVIAHEEVIMEAPDPNETSVVPPEATRSTFREQGGKMKTEESESTVNERLAELQELVRKVWEALPNETKWGLELHFANSSHIYMDLDTIALPWLYVDDQRLRGPECAFWMLEEMDKAGLEPDLLAPSTYHHETQYTCNCVVLPKKIEGLDFYGQTREEAIVRCWLTYKEGL